jgi:hypothetical protein
VSGIGESAVRSGEKKLTRDTGNNVFQKHFKNCPTLGILQWLAMNRPDLSA